MLFSVNISIEDDISPGNEGESSKHKCIYIRAKKVRCGRHQRSFSRKFRKHIKIRSVGETVRLKIGKLSVCPILKSAELHEDQRHFGASFHLVGPDDLSNTSSTRALK